MQTFLNVAVWVYLPVARVAVGITGTFFLFAAVGCIALAFVATQVPETRGRSLEALEADVTSGRIFAARRRSSPSRVRARRSRGPD